MESNAKDGIGTTSNRDMIRNTIDKLIPAVKSFEQLVECLTNIYGWNIRVTSCPFPRFILELGEDRVTDEIKRR